MLCKQILLNLPIKASLQRRRRANELRHPFGPGCHVVPRLPAVVGDLCGLCSANGWAFRRLPAGAEHSNETLGPSRGICFLVELVGQSNLTNSFFFHFFQSVTIPVSYHSKFIASTRKQRFCPKVTTWCCWCSWKRASQWRSCWLGPCCRANPKCRPPTVSRL